MSSKNQGRVSAERRARIYNGNPDCLPRYNFGSGAGWKTKCKTNRRLSFNIKSKNNMSRGYN